MTRFCVCCYLFQGWVVVSKRLDPGSSMRLPGMTRFLTCWLCFGVWLVVSKRLDPGSSHPTKPLRASAGAPAARDDTVFFSLLALFWGNLSTIPPFHLSTSKTPFHLQRSCHPYSIYFQQQHVTTSQRQHDIPSPCPPFSG